MYKRVLLFLFLIFYILACVNEESSTSKTPSAESRWVIAQPGLNIREKPDINSSKTGSIPFKQEVQLLEEIGETQTLQGVSGKWSKILWKGMEGWVFGGFLADSYPPDNIQETEISKQMKDHFYSGDIEDIITSSTLPPGDTADYVAANLIDGTWKSWCEGVAGNGIGETIKITFQESVYLTTMYLKNGYGELKYYHKNNRVKNIKISDSQDKNVIVELADTPFFQKLSWEQPLQGKQIEIEIIDVYMGDSGDDACITEICFADKAIQKQNFEIKHDTYENNIDYTAFQETALSYLHLFLQDVLKRKVKWENDSLYIWQAPVNAPEGKYVKIDFDNYLGAITDSSISMTGGPSSYEYCKIFPTGDPNKIVLIQHQYSDSMPNSEIYIYSYNNGNWQELTQGETIFSKLKLDYFIDLNNVSYTEVSSIIQEMKKQKTFFYRYFLDEGYSIYVLIDHTDYELYGVLRQKVNYNIIKGIILEWNGAEFVIDDDSYAALKWI